MRRARVAVSAVAVAASVACAVASAARGDGISVRAFVDRNRLAPGEAATLSVEIAGTQSAPAPEIVSAEGVRVRYLGPSTEISLVNGRMNASVTHRYRLQAEREGTFTVGPFRVRLQGRTYEAQAVRLTVSRAAGQARPASDVRLAIAAERRRPFVGERVPFEVRLYVGGVRLEDLAFPEVAAEGMAVEAFAQPSRSVEVVGGRRYTVLAFRSWFTPLRAGRLALGPATIRFVRVVPGRGGLFDPFFFGERRQDAASADPVDVEVRPLPQDGRPPHFDGAVGRFDLVVTASPDRVRVGDPVTVRMVVRGEGNPGSVKAPHLRAGGGFRAYDPVEVEGGGGTGVVKTFEQVLIPLEENVSAVPAVEFAYFDPAAERYVTLRRGPFPLRVEAAAADLGRGRPAVVAAPSPPAREPEAARDIVYIKDRPGRLRRSGSGTGWPGLLAAHAVPVLLAAGWVAFLRRRERRARDPRLVRLREARRRMRAVLGGPPPDAGDAFWELLSAAVREYLGARLGLPPGAVEREAVLRCLSRDGAGASVAGQARELLDLLDGARYRPGGLGDGERSRALALAERIYRSLERRRRVALRAAAVLVALVPAAGNVARAGSDVAPHTLFFRANAAYGEGRYEEAMALYQELVGAGWESGPLYYNLGNACFRSGRVGCAVLNYERARRRLPRDPDVRANLEFAREQAGVEGEPDPLWARLLFPTAHLLAWTEAWRLAAGAWWVAWAAVAVAAGLERTRRAGRRVAAAALVAWAVLAGGAAYRARVLEAPAVVVVAPGRTPVLFEPREGAGRHFEAREGTLLWVSGHRPGWWKVRRADGLRGWISERAVEAVSPAMARRGAGGGGAQARDGQAMRRACSRYMRA